MKNNYNVKKKVDVKFALFSGSQNPEYQEDVVYFLMAKFFQFTPEQVDGMEKERVYKLLWLEERWKEKENQENKND